MQRESGALKLRWGEDGKERCKEEGAEQCKEEG
jgi:hypothetical protein